jgi:uncharacterized protein (TIGR03118 family)
MHFSLRSRVSIVLPFIALLVLLGALMMSGIFRAHAIHAAGDSHSGGFYRQTNLVSDVAGLARFQDKNLVNSWGLSHSPTSPWWISDNGTGLATVYNGDGTPFLVAGSPLVVTIPLPAGVTPPPPAAPTGNVFNSVNSTNPNEFVVTENGKSGPSTFMFATEDGTISGWNRGVDPTNAILAVDRSAAVDPQGDVGAVYKGLATGSNDKGDFIYATNFRFGQVEQFDASFKLVNTFTDPQLSSDCPIPGPPAQCFAPFGIQNIGGLLFVTFALQNAAKHDDVAGPGNGFVDVFDTSGNLVQRLASHGTLNSPWGLTLAPEGFGRFGKDLLVGNFGDGHINAFEPDTGAFRGQLKDQRGNPITINGLWALGFGNGGLAGPTDTLFFTAGINDEADGLFGSITKGEG